MIDATATLRTAREETIDALCREFARDALTMPELERRLTRAREARSQDELRALLADLPAPVAPAPAPSWRSRRSGVEPDATRTSVAAKPENRLGSHLAIAVMGGTRRVANWAPPGNMLAIAIMGGVELDFREAILQPGVTDINVFAFWGGVQITVPPNVRVESHGLAIMGGFEAADRPSSPGQDAPVIRIIGVAIMAGVEVKVRAPGERKGNGGETGTRDAMSPRTEL